MSSYVKATNFATKDTLPTGDANKIVKGTEIDNEFNAISGAISSKADTASPTFTGTPAAPTAASGTNTTQLATTAFATGAVNDAITTERTATATLTNKTINADNNTIAGIAASSFVLSNGSGNIDGAAAQKVIPSGAVVGTTDTQTLTNKTLTTPTINSAQIPTISGSAPLYLCRAWVNFNGTGTVAIRASGNVSSITDNGTGQYTVNFTTAMPDADFSANVSQLTTGGSAYSCLGYAAQTTAGVGILTVNKNLLSDAPSLSDTTIVCVSVFR